MHFPAHQIQTPSRQQTAIPVVVVTTPYDPTLLTAPDLSYPLSALKAGIQGKVLLQMTVSPEGKVTAVHVLSGIPVWATAAKSAASQNIYKPSPVAGSKPTTKQIEFDFRLVKP